METLHVLWTTDNKDTFFTMLSTYTLNAKKRGWWEHINVIIWGASAQLAAENTQVQTEVREMMHAGIHLEACKHCSDELGVTEQLEKLGVEVKYMGVPLTTYLKSGEKLLTI